KAVQNTLVIAVSKFSLVVCNEGEQKRSFQVDFIPRNQEETSRLGGGIRSKRQEGRSGDRKDDKQDAEKRMIFTAILPITGEVRLQHRFVRLRSMSSKKTRLLGNPGLNSLSQKTPKFLNGILVMLMT